VRKGSRLVERLGNLAALDRKELASLHDFELRDRGRFE
jgi:hypothetical protein